MTSQPALPPTDPAYSQVSGIISSFHGVTLAPGETHEQLLSAVLDVVVDDRVAQLASSVKAVEPDAATKLLLGEDPDEAETLGTVGVQTGVSATGAYITEISYSDDVVRVISPGEVPAYCDALMYAAVLANHNAGVLRQLVELFGVERENAQQFIIEMRESLPGVDQKAVHPLIVRPSVGHRTGDAYVYLRLKGTKQTWSWDIRDVLAHVQIVRAVSMSTDIDAAYRRQLVGAYGLDDSKARRIVHELGDWREDVL